MGNKIKNFDAAPFDLTNICDSVQSLYLTDSPREKLVVIVGATSAGKSSLAIDLAEHFGTEIISADSMAVYKNFNVGTAKPSQAELERVPHHLIDILDAEQVFSMVEFVQRAREIISDINARGKIPIVAGGTGLYVQALVEGYDAHAGEKIFIGIVINVAKTIKTVIDTPLLTEDGTFRNNETAELIFNFGRQAI